MNIFTVVAEVIKLGSRSFVPTNRDLLEEHTNNLREWRKELEQQEQKVAEAKYGDDYPLDLRFDAARTRLQRFRQAFDDYKGSGMGFERAKRAFNDLKAVKVCPGCEELYGYVGELLQSIEEGASIDEVAPVMESYLEGILFAVEATHLMKMKWGYVKKLEDLTDEEKRELEKQVGETLEM